MISCLKYLLSLSLPSLPVPPLPLSLPSPITQGKNIAPPTAEYEYPYIKDWNLHFPANELNDVLYRAICYRQMTHTASSSLSLAYFVFLFIFSPSSLCLSSFTFLLLHLSALKLWSKTERFYQAPHDNIRYMSGCLLLDLLQLTHWARFMVFAVPHLTDVVFILKKKHVDNTPMGDL